MPESGRPSRCRVCVSRCSTLPLRLCIEYRPVLLRSPRAPRPIRRRPSSSRNRRADEYFVSSADAILRSNTGRRRAHTLVDLLSTSAMAQPPRCGRGGCLGSMVFAPLLEPHIRAGLRPRRAQCASRIGSCADRAARGTVAAHPRVRASSSPSYGWRVAMSRVSAAEPLPRSASAPATLKRLLLSERSQGIRSWCARPPPTRLELILVAGVITIGNCIVLYLHPGVLAR